MVQHLVRSVNGHKFCTTLLSLIQLAHMNTAAIYIKTQPEVKAKAQKIAKDLGLSLSSLVDSWLRQFVKTKSATLSAEERPSKYLIESIRKSEEQLKKGETSPTFDNAKDAIEWLHKQVSDES